MLSHAVGFPSGCLESLISEVFLCFVLFWVGERRREEMAGDQRIDGGEKGEEIGVGVEKMGLGLWGNYLLLLHFLPFYG